VALKFAEVRPGCCTKLVPHSALHRARLWARRTSEPPHPFL